VIINYGGPVVSIPDNNATGVNIVTNVSQACTITDFNFRFDGTPSADPASTTVGVNHSWVGDLTFRLTSPGGTAVSFFDRPGVPASGSGCDSNNLAQLTLDDESGFPSIEGQCGANSDAAFPSGSFAPSNPLTAFDGQSATGNWTLNVTDQAGSDTGSVRAFTLIFTCFAISPTPSPTPIATPTPTPVASPTPTPPATPTPNPTPTPIQTPTPNPTPTPGGVIKIFYAGPVVVVPDNVAAGVNINMPVSGVGTLTDLDFKFEGTAGSSDPLSTTVGLNHSWVGDIIVKLTSPAGTTVTIMNRPGLTAGACDSNNLFDVTLNDDGGFPAIASQCGANNNAAFPSGSFAPNNPLSAFDGQNADGSWTINVSDNAGQDIGSMRSFSLSFSRAGLPPVTPTPTPVTTPTPIATPTPTPQPTPTPVATPTPAPSPTPSPAPSPTPSPTPGCSPNPNGVQDGGFEMTTSTGTNVNWMSTSTLFGTSLCAPGVCNTSAPPRTGTGWVWFDGTPTGAAAESGTARQMITIPPGNTATLNYYLRVAGVTAPSSSTLTVSVDGTIVQTITEPAAAESGYTLRTVDLSAYANGQPRMLSFNYSRPAGTTGSDNFLVDDVTLAMTCGSTMASMTGRVVTPNGTALRNAVVSLTNPDGVRMTATTSSFGVFSFGTIPTGQTYILSVSSRRYRFAPQSLAINGNLTNINLVGLE